MVVDSHAHVFAAASETFPRDVHELYPADARDRIRGGNAVELFRFR